MSSLNIGVATVSLPDLDTSTAIEQIAAAGYAGIEWRVEPKPGAVRDMAAAHPFLADGHRASIRLDVDDARRTAAATRSAGLEVVGLCPYIEMDDEDTLSLAFRLADAAEAPQIRIQAPRPGRTGLRYPELFDRFRRFFDLAATRAAESGISALLEIHHRTICPSAELAHRILVDHDPHSVGAIYDVGNLVWEGYVEHDLALDLLGPFLQHVHVKNAAVLRTPGGGWAPTWVPLDEGVVDVPAVVGVLERHGYSGWMSIEEMSQDRSSSAALLHNAAQFREWGILPVAPGMSR